MARIRTTLYRLRSAEGALLYVGVAGNPGRRFEQHARVRPWWGEVAVAELTHFRSRVEALVAEERAIRDENPLYNRAASYRTVGVLRAIADERPEVPDEPDPPNVGDWFIQPMDRADPVLSVGRILETDGTTAVLQEHDALMNEPTGSVFEQAEVVVRGWLIFPHYHDWRFNVDYALTILRSLKVPT